MGVRVRIVSTRARVRVVSKRVRVLRRGLGPQDLVWVVVSGG